MRDVFGSDLQYVARVSIEKELLDLSNNQHLKGFIEHSIALALKRDKPLLYRTWRGGSVLIFDRVRPATSLAQDIVRCVGDLDGTVPGLMSLATTEHPRSEPVHWAEAIKLDFEVLDGNCWLVLRPIVWIWPRHARIQAVDFLDRRLGGRFNKQADALLSAWLTFLLPAGGKGSEVELIPFEGIDDAEHPRFVVNTRTGFSRRIAI